MSIVRIEHLYLLVIDDTVDDHTVPPLGDHDTAELPRPHCRLGHDVFIRSNFVRVNVSVKDHSEKPGLAGCRRRTRGSMWGIRRILNFQSLNDMNFQELFK